MSKTDQRKPTQVSKSEANYLINLEGAIEKREGNVQSSYNINKKTFEKLINSGILVADESLEYARKSKDGNAYVVADNYTFQLGKGVLWLIGEEYGDEDKKNKFIASLNKNGKYQMYRAVYDQLIEESEENKDSYEWFVKLFDKNLAGNILKFDVDSANNILTFDVSFQSIPSGSLSVEEEEEEEEEAQQQDPQDGINNLIDSPHNRIIFGAPGTGKSNKIDKDIKRFNLKDSYERVTVHPNYTYGQFVGAYKPVSKYNSTGEEIVSYEFVPGPFLRVLIKSLSDSQKSYLLAIEEINRANPAAIFGDVFQLLDRNSDGKSTYTINISEEMKKYFNKMEKELGKTLLIKGNQLALPSNMYIWATMNSADQGVYPMDSAFKRRWSFEYIGINDNEQELIGKSYEYIELKNISGGYTKYSWNIVRKTINEKLRGIVQEDKLLGPFFLSTKELELKREKFDTIFKSKVLMYLFEDVLKHKKCDFFVDGVKTLSDVMNYYDQGEIFKFTFEEASNEQASSDQEEVASNEQASSDQEEVASNEQASSDQEEVASNEQASSDQEEVASNEQASSDQEEVAVDKQASSNQEKNILIPQGE